MAWRTTEPEVRGIIATDLELSIEPFIEAAAVLVDRVETLDTGSILTTANLVQIETYLAAHFYALRDQLFSEKKTGDASAVFQGKTEMGLDFTSYGQMAKVLDVTGALASFGKKILQVIWAGLPPSDQTDYVDRD